MHQALPLPSAELIKSALLEDRETMDALDELITTGEAAFHLARCAAIDEDLKEVFERLQKQFRFWGNVVLLERMRS